MPTLKSNMSLDSKDSDIVIISEKPSVARELAQVVGAHKKNQGYFQGGGHTVTWAIGHLVTLPEPHQIKPLWKTWSFAHLPMLPSSWPLVVVEKTEAQFEIIKKLLSNCKEVICATDAGREGELIFRYIYELSGCDKPVKRLWISSLTAQAIQTGLRALRPSAEYDPLANAAKARSRADWLYGMNLSRAYALTTHESLFVGRVQTPTLAMVVARDQEIENFKPQDYFTIEGKFSVPTGLYRGFYIGEKRDVTTFFSAKEKRFLVSDPKLPVPIEVEAIRQRVLNGTAKIASLDGKTVKQLPPQLYDLTELQRHSHKLFGFTASETLNLAQSLYEKHKLISYPRTSSRHLSESVAETLPEIVALIRDPYEKSISNETGKSPLSKRFVDDTQITDHHAIIPTNTPVKNFGVTNDEQKIYDLICRRLLMAWQPDYVTAVSTLITEVGELDFFKTQGTRIVAQGWKALELISRTRSTSSELPEGLEIGNSAHVVDVEALQKRTEPPPRLTEATLLTGMETAGRNLDDRDLAEFMRESGLGTPATRAGIIETLLSREYITREGKSLKSTPLGQRLIRTVHPSVKSPILTAQWEKRLSDLQNGETQLKDFMIQIESEVRDRISEIVQKSPEQAPEKPSTTSSSLQTHTQNPFHTEPQNSLNPEQILGQRFGLKSFRPGQENVCRLVTEGKDVLLVMPTGAGKSICYQIPGLCRGGTTLVVSPLVALMEDQVLKLQQLKVQADRIHAGRSREDSRLVCQKYLSGALEFLFIAPERLGVPGFFEFLKRRAPRLIAIDEAHCISQWGHDFRPDYRALGERLTELRPTPIIALTATATPVVQNDICTQLGLVNEERVIQGFRRDNISIDVAEIPPDSRFLAIQSLLKKEKRLPAIVYAPTRKKTDELTDLLSKTYRVGSYHAGMPASGREKVQAKFISDELDVMVATVAFGMGIDKPNIRTVIHAAMPGSVESYYQEIGRAGRDGLPSSAFLLHSYADQKTHEYFFGLNYPEVEVLQLIFDQLTPEGASFEQILNSTLHAQKSRGHSHTKSKLFDSENFERALEQLWVHRGVTIDGQKILRQGFGNWTKSYLAQKELKQKQLKQMHNYATRGKCRMLSLVSHFGDQKDSGKPCGTCDICDPKQANSLSQQRSLSDGEKKVIGIISQTLEDDGSMASGKLFGFVQNRIPALTRGEYELFITLLERAHLLESKETTFELDGREITYCKLSLRTSAQKIVSHLDKFEISVSVYEKKIQKKKKSSRTRKRKRRSGRSPEASF